MTHPNESTQSWPDLAIGLYDKLTGRGAEITYDFEDFTVQVPDSTGANSAKAPWTVNGTLNWTGPFSSLGDSINGGSTVIASGSVTTSSGTCTPWSAQMVVPSGYSSAGPFVAWSRPRSSKPVAVGRSSMMARPSRAMKATPLSKHLQSLGSQAVKFIQSLNKYLVVWAIRIELGNFFFNVVNGHENLPEQGVEP